MVIAHGSNDEVYPTPREQLEQLIQSGTENMCFLRLAGEEHGLLRPSETKKGDELELLFALRYHTADSGRLPTKHLTRKGDKHNMERLAVVL